MVQLVQLEYSLLQKNEEKTSNKKIINKKIEKRKS